MDDKLKGSVDDDAVEEVAFRTEQLRAKVSQVGPQDPTYAPLLARAAALLARAAGGDKQETDWSGRQ